MIPVFVLTCALIESNFYAEDAHQVIFWDRNGVCIDWAKAGVLHHGRNNRGGHEYWQYTYVDDITDTPVIVRAPAFVITITRHDPERRAKLRGNHYVGGIARMINPPPFRRYRYQPPEP